MGSGIAEHAECSFYEICKAALFALLAHRRTRVDRDARGIAAKRVGREQCDVRFGDG